jgi:hypothetical protein
VPQWIPPKKLIHRALSRAKPAGKTQKFFDGGGILLHEI